MQKILKQNAERREKEHAKNRKWLDIVASVLLGAGVLVGLVVVLAAHIVWLLLALAGIVVGAFAVGSMFSGGGVSSDE